MRAVTGKFGGKCVFFRLEILCRSLRRGNLLALGVFQPEIPIIVVIEIGKIDPHPVDGVIPVSDRKRLDFVFQSSAFGGKFYRGIICGLSAVFRQYKRQHGNRQSRDRDSYADVCIDESQPYADSQSDKPEDRHDNAAHATFFRWRDGRRFVYEPAFFFRVAEIVHLRFYRVVFVGIDGQRIELPDERFFACAFRAFVKLQNFRPLRGKTFDFFAEAQ